LRGVSAATWKRLERLEKIKEAVKYVGGWPPIIYDTDEWSAIAEPMQKKLLLSTLDRELEPASEATPDPMDVTYKYKANLRPC